MPSATEPAPLELPTDPADPAALRAFLDRAVALARPDGPPRPLADDMPTVEALIGCMDLTCLDADVTDDVLVRLCDRARRPDHDDATCPPVAAVCSWSDAAATLAGGLAGSTVAACVVAGGFPSGRQPAEVVAADVAAARAAGAVEVDVPLHRGLLGAGRDAEVLARLRAAVDAAGDAPVKVILETGALGPEHLRRAAWLAVLAGARWLKTSTGQLAGGATVEAVTALADVAATAAALTGRPVGVKAAGGLKTVEQALAVAAPVAARLGAAEPGRLRLGASGLLDALVAQRRALR